MPQSQIIEHFYCDKCNNRETSRLCVGLTLRGIQLWCNNCNKSVIHIELHGEMLADPEPQGKFNERNKHGGAEKINDFTITTKDLEQKRNEELTNSDVDVSNVKRRCFPRL